MKRYGFNVEADKISAQTINMVQKNGFYEYFNPLTGDHAGVGHFSWTASLIIDLLSKQKQSQT